MALSVVSKVQHSKRLRKWWEKVIIIVFNDVSNLFFVFVFVCMWVWSVFLMLDEEYNLLKKITDNFKRPKQTFFSFFKNTIYFKEQADGQKKAFGSKYLPFHLIVLNDRMFFSPRFTWKPWEQSPSYSRPCKKAALKSTCLQIGDGC